MLAYAEIQMRAPSITEINAHAASCLRFASQRMPVFHLTYIDCMLHNIVSRNTK